MLHPRSFCPTCASCLSLWLAGLPGSPSSSREQTGRVELVWGWGYGRTLPAPLCHLLLLEPGPLADCHLPAQGTKDASTGAGHRWPRGQCPGWPATSAASAAPPPRGKPPSRALPGASASETRREPFPLWASTAAASREGPVQRLRASERGQGGGCANPPATRRPAAPRPAAGARRSRRAGADLTRPSCRRCKSPTC